MKHSDIVVKNCKNIPNQEHSDLENIQNKSSLDTDNEETIFAQEGRMWLALAGHEKDLQRIPLAQFILLSHIAACGEKGILQPELTKISGQDKRSVPKRTDALQKHGYITKRAIQAPGARTSLCKLKRFISDETKQVVSDARQPESTIEPVFRDDRILIDRFLDVALQVIKEFGPISWLQFKAKLVR